MGSSTGIPYNTEEASSEQNSRKLNLCHCSFPETPDVGVVIYAADPGFMHELPVNGVFGNSETEQPAPPGGLAGAERSWG